jgi:hypothetical protein
MLAMRASKSRFSRVEYVAALWLAAMLAVGLWQGYGAWLFGGAHHAG